ncbi:MAG: CoA transferase, partial [Dehalococcoidia bacterium]
MADGALAGVRILECGDFVAAPFAACMLGHLGADVVKVEPPAGDSNRRRGPYPGGIPNPEAAGLHLFLDQAKRSVVLDLDTEAGRAELRRLAAAADALIASGSAGLLRRRGLTYEMLRDANTALVVTTVTPYGLDGADATDADLPMRELCDIAASGWLSMSPGALDDPNLPPLKPFGQQAHFQAGLHAAIATLAALAARDGGAGGQAVDISV